MNLEDARTEDLLIELIKRGAEVAIQIDEWWLMSPRIIDESTPLPKTLCINVLDGIGFDEHKKELCMQYRTEISFTLWRGKED